MWWNSVLSDVGISLSCNLYARHQIIVVEIKIAKKGTQKPTNEEKYHDLNLTYGPQCYPGR